jgi:hypothetical protein
MARQTRGLPSIYEKQVYDGTAGREFAINLRKASLRWHGRPGVCHQITKGAFEMVRIGERLPSNNKMEIFNGMMSRSFAIK